MATYFIDMKSLFNYYDVGIMKIMSIISKTSKMMLMRLSMAIII